MSIGVLPASSWGYSEGLLRLGSCRKTSRAQADSCMAEDVHNQKLGNTEPLSPVRTGHVHHWHAGHNRGRGRTGKMSANSE